MSDWSIDLKTLHCSHHAGLTAYIDLQPTLSGAIRCIGPFGTSHLPEPLVREAMTSLTLKIEDQIALRGQYVIWGAYLDEPQYEYHAAIVLNSACGFMPNLSLRSELLIQNNARALAREWVVRDNNLCHKSGLLFRSEPGNPLRLVDVDVALIHPQTINSQLLSLAGLIPRIENALRENTPNTSHWAW